MSGNVSGLAASIRAATESETFDLGSQSVTTITNTIRNAFAEDFSLEEMIRITFVTGAGKQARSRYDDGAAKAVTSTLRELGYEDDRGASCVMECGGSFKLQHDTGKNLKTVVVFPKVKVNSSTSKNNDDGENIASLLPKGSPVQYIATVSLSVFTKMISSKCPSWSQKKGCLGALEVVQEMLEAVEGKLMKGEVLDAAEQQFYDTVVNLEEKMSHCKTELHNQILRHEITQQELDLLKHQNLERIQSLEGNSKNKKPLEKAKERKRMLNNIDSPIEPYKLRHEVAIRKLRKQLLPLLELSGGGRLRSVKETQSLSKKVEMENEIERLEYDSRGWFEEDDVFESRLQASRDAFLSTIKKSKANNAKKNYAKATSSSSAATTNTKKWVVPGASSASSANNSWGGNALFKKKKKQKGGAVFAAMMMDSDDDNDDDDESYEQNIPTKISSFFSTQTQKPTVAQQQPKKKPQQQKQQQRFIVEDEQNVVTTIQSSIVERKAYEDDDDEKPKTTKTSKRKKKKSKKKSANNNNNNDDDEVLDNALAERLAEQKMVEEEKKEKEEEVRSIITVISVLLFIFHILKSIITFIFLLFFGSNKKKKNKKQR